MNYYKPLFIALMVTMFGAASAHNQVQQNAMAVSSQKIAYQSGNHHHRDHGGITIQFSDDGIYVGGHKKHHDRYTYKCLKYFKGKNHYGHISKNRLCVIYYKGHKYYFDNYSVVRIRERY